MTQMTINLNTTFPINGYSRSTEIQNGKVYSSANVSVNGTESYPALLALYGQTISSITIESEGKQIYSITNQNGRITNINESLDGEVMRLYMNIFFSVGEDNSDTEYI